MSQEDRVVVLRVRGRLEDVLPRLFRDAEDGRLHFGLLASSQEPTSLHALEMGVVVFREMILERMSQYGLSVTREPEGVLLAIHPRGSRRERDSEIVGWIQWSIGRLGLDVTRLGIDPTS